MIDYYYRQFLAKSKMTIYCYDWVKIGEVIKVEEILQTYSLSTMVHQDLPEDKKMTLALFEIGDVVMNALALRSTKFFLQKVFGSWCNKT